MSSFGLALAAFTIVAATPALHAQAVAESTLLRQLLAIGTPDSTASAGADRCAAMEGRGRQLCTGLLQISRAEASGDRGTAGAARDMMERLVGEHPTWAPGWFGLGLARVQVSRARGFSRQGPLHPAGSSNEVGAGNALIRALELDSTFAPAAEALAGLSLPREGRSVLGTRVAMLRARRQMLSAQGLYAAGLVELAGGSADTARTFLAAALVHGTADSGLILLAAARAGFSVGDSEEGRASLVTGAHHRSPAADAAYRRELSWVATPDELGEWDAFPADASRAAWLDAFWAKRDVLGGLRSGERLIEHYRRMEYALQHFFLTLPPSGRHRNSQSSGTIDQAEVEVADRDVYAIENDELRALVVYRRMMGHESAFRTFRSSQTLLDDRGVVYVRHGQPQLIGKTTGGQAHEVWRYEREEGPLILSFKEEDFDGQAGASVLVPTLINAVPFVKNQLCHVDPALCAVSAGPQVSSGVLADARQTSFAKREVARREGTQQIEQAARTDFQARAFKRRISPIIQLYGLGNLGDSSGRIVVTFAVPGDQLAYSTPPEAGGRAVYPLRVELSTVSRAGGPRFGVDTLRRFVTARPLGAGQFLTGMVELLVPPGEHVTSVVITQEDRGAIAALPSVLVCRSGGSLCLSDLVLGLEGGTLRWSSGTQAVPLNPGNAFARGGTVDLYFQVHGQSPGAKYETIVELFDASDSAYLKPALAIRFTTEATARAAEVVRAIELRELSAGRYRLRLTTRGRGESASAVAWLTVRD